MRLVRPLLLALFVLLPLAASAAEGQAVRYGLSEQEFRAENTRQAAQGRRLFDLTVAQLGGKLVVGAIWTPGPAGTAEDSVYFGRSSDEVRAMVVEQKSRGASLELLETYESDGKPAFALAFTPKGVPPLMLVAAFMGEKEAGETREKLEAQGMVPVRFDVIAKGQDSEYFIGFVRGGKLQVDVAEAGNERDFLMESAKLQFRNLWPASICMFRDEEGHTRLVGMHDDRMVGRNVILDQPQSEFGEQIGKVVAEGRIVMDMDSIVEDGKVRYSAVHFPKS